MQRWALPSPAGRTAVRGKSGIADLQLPGGNRPLGGLIFGRRPIKSIDRSSREEKPAGEFGEPQARQVDVVAVCGDAQQHESDHRRDQLQPHGVLVCAEKPSDLEMLLDPAEQQLDGPARLVERGDLDRRTHHVVGEHDDLLRLAVLQRIAANMQATQPHRQLRVALAGEFDLAIPEHGITVAARLRHISLRDVVEAGVALGTRDEEGSGLVDAPPPFEIVIALVEDIGRAGLDRRLLADFDIIDIGGRDLDAEGAVVSGIVDDVHLHAVDAAVRTGEVVELAQRNGGRIDEAQELGAVAAGFAVELAGEAREQIGEHADGPASVGFGESGAGERAGAEVIMEAAAGVEGGLEGAQAGRAAELGADQRDEVIPALERFVVGVALVAGDDAGEGATIDRLEQVDKNAILKAHAWSFIFQSRQPENTPKLSEVPGMRPRSIELFPRTAVRCGERDGRRFASLS